jgi:hypothetical protein
MKSAPSETRFDRLVSQLGHWALNQGFGRNDADLIVEVIEALRAAEDTLFAAGFLAGMLVEPRDLRFAWSSGQQEFDADAALRQMQKSADYLVWAVNRELYGPDPDKPAPKSPPSRFHYTARSNGVRLKINSPVALGVDEVCKLALQEFARAGMPVGRSMQLSQCDASYTAYDSATVQTKDHLAKGMPGGNGKEQCC